MICRGIAAVLVVLEHSIIRYPIDLRAQAEWCVVLSNYINSFHMPLFFLLSGYFTFHKGIKEPGKWLSYHWKKMLIPYFVMGMIDLLPRILLQSLVHNPANITESLIKIIFYGGYFWFLVALFFIQLISSVFVQLGKQKQLFAVSVVLLIASRILPFPQLFCMGQIAYYLFFYILGGYYRENESTIEKKTQILNGFSILVFVLFGGLGNKWLSIIVALAGSWLALQIARGVLKKGRGKLLALAGKYSLQIYLFNGMVLGVGRTLFVKAGIIDPFILITANTLFVLVMEAIAIWIVQKIPMVPFLFGIEQKKT